MVTERVEDLYLLRKVESLKITAKESIYIYLMTQSCIKSSKITEKESTSSMFGISSILKLEY